MSSMASTPVRHEHNLKRRKIRKGTSSCWECKHRKRRCDFEPGSSSVCVSCQRRGIPCISQEYTETANDEYEAVARHIGRVEDLVHQLVHQRGAQPHRPYSREITGEPLPFDVSKYSTLRSVSHERISRGSSLTGYLNAILPAPHIAVAIFSSNKQYDAPLQILQDPPSGRDPYAEQSAQIADIFPTVHPVALARRLIRLALCLQELDEGKSQKLNLSFKEPGLNTAHRYFHAASSLVMSQDYLVSSLDGLETLMLQSRYHISMGELHVAWRIYRRASRIAYLMLLPQQAKTSGTRANSVWFQMVYSDCFLSLMLGQPIAITDNIVGTTETQSVNNPAQYLERVHVAIAQRIIARNLHIQHCRERERIQAIIEQSNRETKALDLRLKMGARSMPTAWWMSPTFATEDTDRKVMEKTAKLLIQTHQYYLLVMLYQPYIIQRLPCNNGGNGCDPIDYMYSTMASVAASREVLARYLILRNFHRSSSYRGFDEKAFAASLGLLFAHFSGHRRGSANVLEHQRPHDLGVLETVITCMEKVSSKNRDYPGSSRSQSLRQFVKIEADAADGSEFLVWVADRIDEHKKNQALDSKSDLEISIPYFGTIHITRQKMRGQCPDVSTATHLSNTTPETSLLAFCHHQDRHDMARDALGALNTTYTAGIQPEFTTESSSLSLHSQILLDTVTSLENCPQNHDSDRQTSLYNEFDSNWVDDWILEENEILG